MARPRVNRPDYRMTSGEFSQTAQQTGQHRSGRVFGSMDGTQQKRRRRRQAQMGERIPHNGSSECLFRKMPGRINGGRSDDGDVLFGNALGQQMGFGLLVGSQKLGCEVIDDDAVDFLGHGFHKRTAARFDMHDGNREFCRSQRRPKRAVGVPQREHQTNIVIQEALFGTDENRACLGRVALAPDGQVNIWRPKTQLVKKHRIKLGGIVLAGMQKDMPNVRFCVEMWHERCQFHNFGARAKDRANDKRFAAHSPARFWERTRFCNAHRKPKWSRKMRATFALD